MLLKDLCTVVSNYYQSNDHWPEFYYLDTGNLTNNCISEIQNFKTVHDLPSRAKQKVSPGNILYSSVRPNQRHYGYIDKACKHLLVSTGFIVLSPNESLVNGKFLYYALTQPWVTAKLQSIAQNNTSAYPAISADNLLNIDINLPSRKTQDKIVDILSGIDNQIERNNEMVKKLQVLAHTTYQRWFEQFEFPNEHGKPYKSSGGKMVWNDELKREIPDGWEAFHIGKIMQFQKGKIPNSLTVKPNGENQYPYLTIDVANGGAPEFCTRDKMPFCNGETIMVMDGAASGDVYIGNIGVLGSTFAMLMPNRKDISNAFIYWFLRTNQSLYKRANTGSTVPHANRSFIEAMNVCMPKNLEHFTNTFDDIQSLIVCLNEENRKLMSLRDVLLPLLINGQLQ